MAYEPKAKKGDLSKKMRKIVSAGILAVAAIGSAVAPATAQAGFLDDLVKSDTLKTIGGNILKSAGGQAQNLGTDKVNKFKCETADNGIWVTRNSSGGGYSTDGKSYKGSASGRTAGKCLTGTAKTRYVQQSLRGEVTSAQATVNSKAQENKAICEMVITDRAQKRSVCAPLAREGRTIGQKIRAQSSLEGIKNIESKFVQASDSLQSCMAEGKAPIKCYMTYNKQKM